MKFILIVFFLIGTFSFGQRSDFDSVNFAKADSIAAKYKGASLENLPVLVHNLTTDLTTDVEKFRAIYTWVCTNIENDYGAFQKTIKKRKKLLENPEALADWNNSFTPKVFKKLIEQRKTACTGYAFLVREMANLTDLKCEIVNGYGRTPTLILDDKSIPNHSWNTIELNGKWYLCDPTWSAGKIILDEGGARFQPDYFDGYFLADPRLFIKNHYPLKISASLLSEPPYFTEFADGPVLYKEAFTYPIIPELPEKMQLQAVKNEAVFFNLQVAEDFQKEHLKLVLNSGHSKRTVEPKISRKQNEITLQFTFEKAGLYDVHIQAKDAYIATYVVKVKRR